MDISSMLEVQVNEVKEADSKENVTPKDYGPSTTNAVPPITQEEYNFYKLMFGNDLPAVRFRKLHCTACDTHIGSAPSQLNNMFEHPVLRTLLCAKCREFYGDGTFEQGDDATDMFCRWCANGGNLYCCSYCSNTFCYKCIKRNFDSVIRKKIEADERWKCFVCDPTDLYAARAVCWALLQHIHTVRRILQNDRTMSPQEIDEKMNFDESQCCPRRRKRKRRRTGSSSEDEDEAYIPTNSLIPILPKRKQKKLQPIIIRQRNYLNGASNVHNGPATIKMQSIAPSQGVITENPSSVHEDDQTLVNNENITNNQDSEMNASTLVNSDTPLTIRCDCQPSQHNSGVIHAVPTRSLLIKKPAPSATSTFKEPVSQNTTQQPSQDSSAMPMVSIPNQNSKLLNQRRVYVRNMRKVTPKPIVPSVIEIDSDSDELTVVESAPKPQEPTPEESPPASIVPVALLTLDDNTNNNTKKEQPVKEVPVLRRRKRGFSEVLRLKNQSIDVIMNNLKRKVQRISAIRRDDSGEEDELKEALYKTKRFHEEIRNAVQRLASISDTVVRDYLTFRGCETANDNETPIDNQSKISVRKDIKLPLDMVCVHESDTESDDSTYDGIISPSELVLATNVLDGLTFSKKKHTLNRGVGCTLRTKNKAVQVYDIIPRDYEKSIGYSFLSREDYTKSKGNKETAPSPPTVPNEHFGKYEEQFIEYLQHIEDRRNEVESGDEATLECFDATETEDVSENKATRTNGVDSQVTSRLEENAKGTVSQCLTRMTAKCEETLKNPDPNETSLKDLIESNSPFVSEMLESMVVPQTAKNSSAVESHRESRAVTNDGNESANEEDVTSTSKAVEELVKIVSQMTDDLGTVKKETRRIDISEKSFISEKTLTGRERHVIETNCHPTSSTENEEDCTIIDD